jgi:acyl-CoA thioester hydrolase
VPPFRFSVRLTVALADTDQNGHVYYGAYLGYVDRAALAYRDHIGVPPLGPPQHRFVVRALSIEYRASALLNEEVEAFVRVASLGATSHTAEVRMERIAPGPPTLLCEGRWTVVGLDGHGGRPTPVPDDMRAAILAFEGDAVRA